MYFLRQWKTFYVRGENGDCSEGVVWWGKHIETAVLMSLFSLDVFEIGLKL